MSGLSITLPILKRSSMIRRLILLLFIFQLPFLVSGQVSVHSLSNDGLVFQSSENSKSILVDGQAITRDSLSGLYHSDVAINKRGKLVRVGKQGEEELFHISSPNGEQLRTVRIPPWTSILPPFIAVLLALMIKEVVFSLLAGVMSGAFIIAGYRLDGLLSSILFFFETISTFIIDALNDAGHLAVIVFSILIGGMVSIISKNGGMQGVLDKVSSLAVSRGRVQLLTYAMGIAIFFDDYANTLIVGNTMRPLSDRFKISREKLAYLVDSTAAPIAAVAFITTWIGAELGFIGSGMDMLKDYPFGNSPYAVFLASLKYSFYPILTLIFMYLLIRAQKDYGPMHQAEERAFQTGQVTSNDQAHHDEPNMEDLSPVSGAPHNYHHALWPVLVTIITTIIGLIVTGMDAAQAALIEQGTYVSGWGNIWAEIKGYSGDDGFFTRAGYLLGLSDSYTALLWSSFLGLMTAVVMTLSARTMNLWDASHWTIEGFKTMIPAVVILVLAWSLASTTEQLGTADFIISCFGQGFHPSWIPVLVFLMAFIISFSTGSSWSTMAILYPLAIPLSWKISMDYGFSPAESQEILLNSIATVLAASVLGDHCSPISDTTILSSLASDCNHLDHVKTQLPYAVTVGVVSMFSVAVSSIIGGSWWLSLLLIIMSTAVFYFIIEYFGKSLNKSRENSI